MPRYKVSVPEIHIWTYEIEATDKLDAHIRCSDADKDLGTKYLTTDWDEVVVEEIAGG